MKQRKSDLGTPSLFEAMEQRDNAMAQVETNAGEDWNLYAHNLIIQIANEKRRFSSDDLMAAMTILPHDNRALGPAIKRAEKAGIIRATGDFKLSVRRHATPIRIWEKAA